MKNNIKLSLLIIIISGIPVIMQAQINLRPGYIITNENDSIYGSIDFRTGDRNALQCLFKNPLTGETKTYRPGEIHAYRFTDDGRFYISRTVPVNGQEQLLFLEYIIQGIISLYYYRENESVYYFETQDGRMVEVSNKEDIVHTDGGGAAVKKDKKYVGVLNYLFSDSSKARKKMKKISFGRDYFTEITKDYHYEVCETGEECIIFEAKKDFRYLILKLSAYAGVKVMTFDIKSGYYTGQLKSASPFIGIDANFSIPRLTRMLSLYVGLDGSKFYGEKLRDITATQYSSVSKESFLLDAELGLRVKPFKGKVVPFLQGGLCTCFLFDRDLRLKYERFALNDIRVSQEVLSSLPNKMTGYSIDVGLEVKINKRHSLSIMLGYSSLKDYSFLKRNTVHFEDNIYSMETCMAGVGFTF